MIEGYIKYNCIWQKGEIEIEPELFTQLEGARSELYALGLIGMYPDGIGFGNLSARSGKAASFIVSGSATGALTRLEPSDYALVTEYAVSENTICCTGQTKASSESLTHAAIYRSLPDAGAVIHVHCLWLWEKLLGKFPSTQADIEYGTPEMALAVAKLALEIKAQEEKIIVMGGHREGILAFGPNLSEAALQIINLYNRYLHD